ncbi:MAG TPA: hypothetical protein VN629_08840 [Castellaniella sp.]|jgi:hypothetical protein|nr:hypothetical protein [Castellaniella sp.]
MSPKKGNGLTAGNSQPAKTLTNVAIIAPTAEVGNPDNALSALIGQFARAGHALHGGACGDFTVIKWGLARYCQDFAAVQVFARQLGAV